MIRPDWNKFLVNAAGDPEGYFEWMCYLLFCRENGKPTGISRYVNQAAIETDPIEVDGAILGWQAKFYDTSLSSHKHKILSSIKSAHKTYGVTKLLFYTNKDWGQGRGDKSPIAKQEAEETAAKLDIDIVWRTASYFESEFVTATCSAISEHFFLLDSKSIRGLQERIALSAKLLGTLRNKIYHNDNLIEIDRSDSIQDTYKFVTNNQRDALLLYGAAGVGKSAVVKMFKERYDEVDLIAIRASELATNAADGLFKGANLDQVVNLFQDDKPKVLYIDSGEQLMDIKDQDHLKEMIKILIDNGWKLIITSRSNYRQSILYLLQFEMRLRVQEIGVEPLILRGLVDMSTEFNFALPSSNRARELLRFPFYLSLYLSSSDIILSDALNTFEDQLWTVRIERMSAGRGQVLQRMALKRAMANEFYLEIPIGETNIVDSLVEDDILAKDNIGVFFAHDVYSDWALYREVGRQLSNAESLQEFSTSVGANANIFKAFRQWLTLNLDTKESFGVSKVQDFLNEATDSSPWANEIIIATLNSTKSIAFLESQKSLILSEDIRGFNLYKSLLTSAFSVIDYDLLFSIHASNTSFIDASFIPTKPIDQGWAPFFKFILSKIELLEEKHWEVLDKLVYDWLTNHKHGVATRTAGLIALYRFENKYTKYTSHGFRVDGRNRVVDSLLMACLELQPELSLRLKEVIKLHGDEQHSVFKFVSDRVISKPSISAVAYIAVGDVLLDIACLEYVLTEEQLLEKRRKNRYDDILDSSERFGLVGGYKYRYHPQSAYQSPLQWTFDIFAQQSWTAFHLWSDTVLREHEEGELASLLESVDLAVGSEKFHFRVSLELWKAYRGSVSLPDIFVCALMAVERYLLKLANEDPHSVFDTILGVLRRTENGAVLSIVLSVALANPSLLSEVLISMLSSRSILELDFQRTINERQVSSLDRLGLPIDAIYKGERREMNALEHRSIRLEQMGLRLQMSLPLDEDVSETSNRADRIHSLLDSHYSNLEDTAPDDEVAWRMILARMDLRKMKASRVPNKDGGLSISFTPELSPELQALITAPRTDLSASIGMTPFFLWTDKVYKGEAISGSMYEQFNDDSNVLEEFRKVAESELNSDSQNWITVRATAANASVILVRDKWEILSEQDRELILKIVFHYLEKPFRDDYMYQLEDGCEQIIFAAPLIAKRFPEKANLLSAILAILSMSQSSGRDSRRFGAFVVDSINRCHQTHPTFARKTFAKCLKLLRFVQQKNPLRNNNRYGSVTYNYRQYPTLNELREHLIEQIDTEQDFQINYSILLPFEVEQIIGLANPNAPIVNQIQIILDSYAQLLIIANQEDDLRYGTLSPTLQYLAKYCLFTSPQEADILTTSIIKPSASTLLPHMLKALIIQEDTHHQVARFWHIWHSARVHALVHLELSFRNDLSDSIARAYLFSSIDWKSTTRSWESISENEIHFFRDFLEESGYSLLAIDSISKVANTIGYPFRLRLLSWIGDLISKQSFDSGYGVTQFPQLEILCRRVCETYKSEIRTDRALRTKILAALTFLYKHCSSAVAFQLREDIS